MQELEKFMIENEANLRLTFFLGVFIIMASLEFLTPRRKLVVNKLKRWANNLSLIILDSITVKILFPIVALGASIFASKNSIGLFNILDIPVVFSVVFSIILLDLIIYWQHRLFHKIDFLWKFHKVHHSDMDYDVTTALRFHPIEIIMSMCIKIFFVILVGVPVVAVIVFEIILNALAMFNHSNIYIPKGLDTILRFFLVTPDMHRIHHSIYDNEKHSNFGFNISKMRKKLYQFLVS